MQPPVLHRAPATASQSLLAPLAEEVVGAATNLMQGFEHLELGRGNDPKVSSKRFPTCLTFTSKSIVDIYVG